MPVTLREVAELAGVSRSAVSRTFTEGASVSPGTRQKVERAADQLGYRPNAIASSLTTGRTKMIGLVADNFHNPMFLEVFDLFTRGLQDRDLRPLLVNLTGETDPRHSVAMLQQYSVDGVVVASSTLPPDFAKAFRTAGIPIVHAFARAQDDPEIDIVGIDNFHCGRMAAQTLIARGYTKIAFMGGPATATSTNDRLSGFYEAARAAPGVSASHSFSQAYSFEAGRAEMLRLLADGPAEAYFCGDDVLSIGALSAISSAGLSVPGDIGIIGLNDMEMAGWESIDLTTIHQPIDGITRAAIDRVQLLLSAPETPPSARLFDCHIVERGTLRPLPGLR